MRHSPVLTISFLYAIIRDVKIYLRGCGVGPVGKPGISLDQDHLAPAGCLLRNTHTFLIFSGKFPIKRFAAPCPQIVRQDSSLVWIPRAFFLVFYYKSSFLTCPARLPPLARLALSSGAEAPTKRASASQRICGAYFEMDSSSHSIGPVSRSTSSLLVMP